ncbi:helix-turn-helix domain containing protein [Amycolatopsis methanolica]|nr:helix-turn-helix domain containing protein [Amycolatopsis methanolica]
MNIIEEHRSTLRAGDTTFSIEVTAVPGGGRDALADRLVIRVGAAGSEGEPVADSQIEVAAGAAATLGSVLSETLRHHAALPDPGGRRGRDRPAGQGKPWTPELERRWIAGESVADIARELARSPGGIRARLPRVGCDPERRGEYLPDPPSMRAVPEGSGDAA